MYCASKIINSTGLILMLSSKVVTPVKTGVQCFCNPLKSLDSGFHRNDDSWAFLTFDEFVNIRYHWNNYIVCP